MHAEVNRSIGALGLEAKLHAITADEAERLYERIEDRFSRRKGALWIWEHFQLPFEHRGFTDDRAFERLSLIVPSEAEDLWFFPDSDRDAVYAYRGGIAAIAAVIGEASAFEYLIAPIGLEWLICESHHGVVYAVGEPVKSRLAGLK